MIARRQFLAGLALAGCTRAPKEEIVPYVHRPPEVTPGTPRFYATALTLDGYATGVLVESHEGRPTKVEGNPDHPASLGATSVFEQAAIYSLYDAKRVEVAKPTRAWSAAVRELAGARNIHVALEPTTSPAVAKLISEIRARFPEATFSFASAGMPVNAWEGARLACGRALEPRYDLARADVIVALDADFLTHGPQRLRLARQLADRRASDAMNRLYAIGPLVTVTSAQADHRLAIRAGEVLGAGLAIASELGLAPAGAGLAIATELGLAGASSRPPAADRDDAGFRPGASSRPPAADHDDTGVRAIARVIARDLASARGRSLVLAGDAQPPEVHALAYALNAALGNIGSTVTFAPSAIVAAGEAPAIPAEVDLLLVAGPVTPAVKARRTVRLELAHPLESWGDARAFDGTASIVQPLIAPLTDAPSLLDVLAIVAGRSTSAHDLVRAGFPDDRAWRRALKRGVIDGTAIAPVDVAIDPRAVLAKLGSGVSPPPEGLELVSDLDPRMHDGRFDGNAWLAELPQPITTLTWTNAATLSPATAARLTLKEGDVVTVDGHRAPVLILPGQADDAVGLSLGWGRALPRGAKRGVTIAKTGETMTLPRTQLHQRLEGRDESVAQHRTLAEQRARPPKPRKRALTLYEPRSHAGPRWGMAIDLSRCIGCDVCMIACQAENNVPVVGAREVERGRIMHWLRVDTYFAEPDIVTQPMLCQHCEKAPCEYVCPVGATTHSPEGLNEMTYNRCVGTRFCSNNCPYKVRRFNWFDYHRHETKTEQLAHNPDVTVRERGVIEKCTFCVQRIHEKRPVTACQQACPTGAIVFGDLAAPDAPVAKLHASDRAFAALDELGTEPRIRYLAKIRNPNPELA